MKPELHDLALSGLRGDALLGFLAAIGTLRAAVEAFASDNVRMAWQPHGTTWQPILRSPAGSVDDLIAALDPLLKARHGHPALTFDADLKVPLLKFSAFSRAQVEEWLKGGNPWGAEMAAAFGCGAIGNDDGNIEDTGFRTMSGAGHQHFLGFMNTLAKETSPAHLKEALFGPWRYADPSPIMRWDAEDDRRYALRWDEPSKDPVRTVRGANRLAIEALPFFPVIPISSRSATTSSFTGRRSHDTFVKWLVWSSWLGVDIVRSLLSHSALTLDEPDNGVLGAMGVLSVFRSQRITLGKYRNFTPAFCLNI